MAAGYIQKPGREWGPCLDPCSHLDCKANREMAASLCKYCHQQIGYERGFYNVRETANDPNDLVHSSCHEANQTGPNIELDPDASLSDADPGL
jgi:hypothetical protein